MFIAHYENTMRNARQKFVEPAIVRTMDQIRAEKRAAARKAREAELEAFAEKAEQARLEALSLQAVSLYRVIDIRDTKTPARQLIEQVAALHDISYREIMGVSRSRKAVAARHDAINAVRSARPDLSTPQLGRIFNRDHTSVLSAIKKFRAGAQSNGEKP